MPGPNRALRGELKIPGDKSISHRALIFSALSSGQSLIRGLSPAADCQSTIDCLLKIGIKIEPVGAETASSAGPAARRQAPVQRREQADSQQTISITAGGLHQLQSAEATLFCGNSGTTMRLLSGLLGGQPWTTTLDGDRSLRQRPMSRVLEPLVQMGAQVSYEASAGYAPFSLTGGGLHGVNFDIPLASAQVQTALLLAGLQADGETSVAVPAAVRDHTLRLFRHIGVSYRLDRSGRITVSRLSKPLPPFAVEIPADLSSAAFFMVAAACLPGSQLHLPGVGINPGRRLVIDLLTAMGADLKLTAIRETSGEPVADILINGSERLRGATVGGDILAAGIDEIPILALAGSLCDGTFSVHEAAELRVKESDRLAAIISNLRDQGARVHEYADGFQIEGKAALPGGAPWRTFGDHRLAMTGLIANLLCEEPVEVDDPDCVQISYPFFQKDLESLLSG